MYERLMVFIYLLRGLFILKQPNYVECGVICPHRSHWNIRGNDICTSDRRSYMCLRDVNSDSFIEQCNRFPELQRPGYFVVWSGNLDGRKCRVDRYQPTSFLTTDGSDCIMMKSSCSEEGQVIYDDGTTEFDRKCRCDHKSGFAFIQQPKNIQFCVPSEEDCSCYHKICPSCQILASDYICRQDETVHCEYIISSGSDEITPPKTQSDKKEDIDVCHVSGRNKTLISVLVIELLLYAVTVYGVFYKRSYLVNRTKGLNSRQIGEETALDDKFETDSKDDGTNSKTIDVTRMVIRGIEYDERKKLTKESDRSYRRLLVIVNIGIDNVEDRGEYPDQENGDMQFIYKDLIVVNGHKNGNEWLTNMNKWLTTNINSYKDRMMNMNKKIQLNKTVESISNKTENERKSDSLYPKLSTP